MPRSFRSSLVVSVFFPVLVASAAAQCDMLKPDAPKPEPPKAQPAKSEVKAEAPLQMMTYQLVLFKAVPGKAEPTAKERGAMMQGHLANLARLNNQRINLLYGPFTDNDPKTATMNELRGLAILDVPDADTARKHFADDPFVKAGHMVLEVKPWLGPKGWFAPPAVPPGDDLSQIQPDPLVFGILVRGAAAKATPSVHTDAQRKEIQAGHLAYMGELNKQGKLVAAGPFMDGGEWRGIVVYRVGTVADAEALAAGDPAVKAGRLALEARPWMTLKGILK